MGATNEMIKQNVFNWLDALIIGAKAMSAEVQCGTEDWKSEASIYGGYDFMVDGILTVHVHNVKKVAEVVEFDIAHQDYTPANHYYKYFIGEDFFIYNGVKFADMISGNFSDEEEEARGKERDNYEENARK